MIEVKLNKGACMEGWERIIINRGAHPKEGECVLRSSGQITRYVEGMTGIEGVVVEVRKPLRVGGAG